MDQLLCHSEFSRTFGRWRIQQKSNQILNGYYLAVFSQRSGRLLLLAVTLNAR